MKSKRGCVISLWYALLFFFMFFALEAFLLRRLLTDLRGGDLFGRCRYPLGSDKAIHLGFHKKSVYICEICGTKPSHE